MITEISKITFEANGFVIELNAEMKTLFIDITNQQAKEFYELDASLFSNVAKCKIQTLINDKKVK